MTSCNRKMEPAARSACSSLAATWGKKGVLGGLLLAAATLQLSPRVEASPKRYTLMCRGGGALAVDLTNINSLIQVRARYAISHSTKAYSLDKLAPGQCAWLDRGMWSNEPRTVVWKYFLKQPKGIRFGLSNGRTDIDHYHWEYQTNGDTYTKSTHVPTIALEMARDPNKVIKFMAYLEKGNWTDINSKVHATSWFNVEPSQFMTHTN